MIGKRGRRRHSLFNALHRGPGEDLSLAAELPIGVWPRWAGNREFLIFWSM